MLGQDLLEGLDGDALEETRLGIGVASGVGLGRGTVVGFDDQQAAQHAGAVVAQERLGQQDAVEVGVQVIEVGRTPVSAHLAVAVFVDSVPGDIHLGDSCSANLYLRAVLHARGG